MMHTYQIYGVPVASSHRFETPLLSSSAQPVLRIERSDEGEDIEPGQRCLYTELDRTGQPDRIFQDPARPRHAVLQFGTAAEFSLSPECLRYHLQDVSVGDAVEIWILGTAFALWNELRGVPALHTAAVEVSGCAVGFLATNKGGKSSLAAALMQLGCPLLTDDVLMVETAGTEVVGRPSYPQMRMWPDQAAHFLGVDAVETLPLVVPHLSKRRIPIGTNGGFGDFCNMACPITTLFLPERRPDVPDVRAERLSPSEALIELVRYSFLAKAVDHLKLAPRRLPVLFALANQVRMYRLVYPEGVQHLSRVADAIVQLVQDG